MKKILLITFLMLVFHNVYAQRGELLYTEFNPYPSMTGVPGVPDEQIITIDINHDGIDETLFYRDFCHDNGDPWQIFYCPTDQPDADKWQYRDAGYELTDTLSLFAHYGAFCHYTILSVKYNHSSPAYDVTRTRGIGVRHAIDDSDGETHYCYGWIEVVGRWTWEPSTWHMMLTVWITRMAYCTIPDYPLRYGQTSLHESIVETDELLANIHPNPTSGIMTVTCENLANIKIINMMGQTVMKSECEGSSATIDMTKQPAGVYFFNITDSNGKKCTRKGVKE